MLQGMGSICSVYYRTVVSYIGLSIGLPVHCLISYLNIISTMHKGCYVLYKPVNSLLLYW